MPRPPVATDVVSLVAVDAAGQPANGFALTSPAPVGTLDCSAMSPSRSATTAGIYECGASADSANVCWAAPDRASLLCANDPWQRGLRLYTVDPPVADIGKTASPEPWALELADGRHCRIRVGGAWGGRSDGLVGAYSCDGGNDVVLQPSTARTAIDTSTSTWMVEVGPLGSGAPDFSAPRLPRFAPPTSPRRAEPAAWLSSLPTPSHRGGSLRYAHRLAQRHSAQLRRHRFGTSGPARDG
ncbi:hypothetical protein ACFYO7_20880 [Nocardia salmonicida]|uniref:hypothetical protein n=1 Tax=Nocardia salmonicida TaxID=53431 RepID=UPI0036CCDA23